MRNHQFLQIQSRNHHHLDLLPHLQALLLRIPALCNPAPQDSLQEILTVKYDDVIGRVKTYEAIIKGENIPKPGIPESFKVLLKELQSLGLDVRVLRDDNTEVEIMETVDMGETDFRSLIEGDK